MCIFLLFRKILIIYEYIMYVKYKINYNKLPFRARVYLNTWLLVCFARAHEKKLSFRAAKAVE